MRLLINIRQILFLLVASAIPFTFISLVQAAPYQADMLKSNQDGMPNTADDFEFTFRFDGANKNDILGYYAYNTGDFDGDGKVDLLVGARQNKVTNVLCDGVNGNSLCKGEAYLIYAPLLEELKTYKNGNKIDLNNSSNWNIKFVGEAVADAGARLEGIADISGDGRDDVVFNSAEADSNLVNSVGATYIIYSELFDNVSTSSNPEAVKQNCQNSAGGLPQTGCVINLDNNDNWNIKFIGSNSGPSSSVGSFLVNTRIADIVDGNSSETTNDIVLTAPLISNENGDLLSGSIYIFHGETIQNNYSGTGNIIELENIYDIRIDGDSGTILGMVNIELHDVNGDNKQDIVVGGLPQLQPNGVLYIIDNEIISNATTPLQLSNPLNYSIKFEGATNDRLYGFAIGHLDDDSAGVNQTDLVISAPGATNGQSSYFYVLYDEAYLNHYAAYGTPGSVLNLSDASNWSVKIQTPATSINPVSGITSSSEIIEDVNNDGLDDLILGHESLTYDDGVSPVRNEAGLWYVIFNETLEQYNCPVNTCNLSDDVNHDIHYIGARAGDGFGYSKPLFRDTNNDDAVDAIAPAWQADPLVRTGAGSVYLIEYFPHSINPNSMTGTDFFDPNGFDFTGVVDATANVAAISKVQFGHHRSFGKHVSEVCPNLDPNCIVNSDEFHMLWLDCDPVDGAFDSKNEAYTCAHSPLSNTPGALFEAPHQLYIRAQDEKGIWTPVSRYQLIQFPQKPPALLTQIQSNNNQPNQQNSAPSTPWLTVAAHHNISTNSARISLERSQVADGDINVAETVAWLAVESGHRGGFEVDNQTIRYESILTGRLFKGYGSCFEQAFRTTFTTSPLVIASMASRYGGDGGWVRRCGLSAERISLFIDEDQYQDAERSHGTEAASILAFSDAFHKRFSHDDQNWQLEVQQANIRGNWYKTVYFAEPFDEPPLLFILPNATGDSPASIRIKQVSNKWFRARVVEPLPGDGTHSQQTIHYLAITAGDHKLPDGTKVTAQTEQISNFKAGAGVIGAQSWHTINF